MKRKFKRAEVTEAASGAPVRVDRKAGVIYDVLILGRKAKNKRRYTREAREDAMQRNLYEGLQVYVGPHKKGRFAKRSPNNHVGELCNVRLLENDEIRGNVKVNRATRGGQLAMEVADRFPRAFGLSQHAWIDGYEENGEKLVTEIAEIAVIDMVKDPGTTDNIFEDFNMADEVATATPPDTGETDTGADSWESCLKELISEIHMDDDLDDDVKLKATKALMKLKELLSGKGDGDDEDEGDEGEEEGEELEVEKLRKRVEQLEKRPLRRRVKSSARTEAVESVTPAPAPAPLTPPPLPKTREEILKQYETQG